MSPIFALTWFELLYNLRQRVFLLFGALIFGQGIWSAYTTATQYAGSSASETAYLTLSSLGIVLAMAGVLLAGQSLTKDLDYRTYPYLYTLPITSRTFVAGRFLGTYLTVLVLGLCYPAGVVSYGLVVPARGDAVAWLSLADGFVRLLAVNALIVVCLAFSLTVLLRGIRGAYIILFLAALYFLLSETDTPLTESDLWLLLDPFGVGMVRESVGLMRLSETPGSLLEFSDMLFINRLLWLGLSLGLLTRAEARFSFQDFGRERAIRSRAETSVAQPGVAVATTPVRLSFGIAARWLALTRLTRLALLTVVRQPVFLITAGLLTVLTVLFATVFGQNPDFPELPITAQMTALRLPMGTLIGLFLIITTNELLFQEQTVGFGSLYDSLPQHNAVLIGGKLLAMTVVAGLLTVVVLLTGLAVQLSSGFRDIDWSRYATDLLLDGWLRYTQLIALTALIGTLLDNRWLSHVVTSLVFLTLSAAYWFGLAANQVGLYSFLPGSAQFSDLVGYGRMAGLRSVVHLMWWGLAGVFVTLALLTGQRGGAAGLRERARQWRGRFSPALGMSLLAFGLLFGGCWWQIRQQLTGPLPTVRTGTLTTRTVTVVLASGRALPVSITYCHPYQVRYMARVLHDALKTGEQLFGPYPFASLHLTETPVNSFEMLTTPDESTPDEASPGVDSPGRIQLTEDQGWTADGSKPDQLDYLDYRLARAVFGQWLTSQMKPANQPGNGFLSQSLADYLALRVVARQFGTDRLRDQLTRHSKAYIAQFARSNQPETSLLQLSDKAANEPNRAALVLNSIAQVWGDEPLSLTIGQFYRHAVAVPASATANAFAGQMNRDLPDSLRYLSTYLTEPLWFDFRVGRMARLPGGLVVEVLAKKWRESEPGRRQSLPINEYVPLAVLNESGREIYRTLVHPDPSRPECYLPNLPDARTVVIDPLGAWPELDRRNNRKQIP